MFQRDYIRRLIEQLGQALHNIYRLRQVEKFDDAQLEIDRAGKSLLGIDLQLLRSLGEDEIIAFFKPGEALDSAKCFAAAALLREEARLREISGLAAQSQAGYRKALRLFLEALQHSKLLRTPENIASIDKLVEKLPKSNLGEAISKKLLWYFEWTGRFAKAEDSLYELLDAGAAIAAEGEAFYQRLLDKPDAELSAGNLPRAEVMEGMREFRQKIADAESRKS